MYNLVQEFGALFMVQRGVFVGAGLLLAVGGCFSDPESDSNPVSEASAGSTGSVTGPDDPTFDSSTSEGDGSFDTTGEPSTDASSSGGPGVAEVRAVHAALGIGAVDIYAEGNPQPLFEDIGFGEATDRIEVDGGLVTFVFRPAGAPADAAPAYVSPDLLLEDGDEITAVAAGVFGSDDEAERFRIVPIAEDWGPGLETRARGRLVHVGPDAPTIRLDGPAEDAVGRFGSTDADGFSLETTGERIEILENVESNPAQLTSFTLPPVAEGDEVLLIATGRLGSLARQPDGFSIIAVGRDGTLDVVRQDPQLFVLHGSRDAGTLETCSGDVELAANFDYGEMLSTRVSPGEYGLDIFNYPAGCVGTPLSPAPNTTGPLEAGERYLLLVTGEVTPDPGEAGIQVATFEDEFPPDDEGQARVRFVHGASYTQVFVGAVDGEGIPEPNVLTQPIGWSVESAEVAVPEGDYVLGIADAADDPSFPAPPLVTLPYQAVGGARQWAIVAGDPTPEADDGFLQVMVVDAATPQWGVVVADVWLP